MSEYLKEQRSLPWRESLRKTIKNKDRVAIPRVKMPEVDPSIRSRNYDEVNLGLTAELARTESQRCLDCVDPTCISGCPVEINIPKFIKQIELGEFLNAASTIKESSTLPAVCGRVCPQERQCEKSCFYTQKLNKDAIAIGHLERFAADYERFSGKISIPETSAPNKIKIAVVGSGPAGLAFAGDMAKMGYNVTVFEALHELGGVLRYGIPEFRLPNNIVDTEINVLSKMGVKFETNCIIGKTLSQEDLIEANYSGIFIGSGAGLPNFMNIPGENLVGVMSCNEYLTRVNLMGAGDPESDTPVYKGENVAVIGGGNTAMDAVRTARRLGAERAVIVYRRSESEMPARLEEIKHAKEEGIEFFTLQNPLKYEGDERGRVKRMLLQKMELGEPDQSGRCRPIPIEGATDWMEVDEVIVSVGVSPNPLIPQSFTGLEITTRGTIVVNQDTMQTSDDITFAGGDIVRGGATVILAMGDGRKAAREMNLKLLHHRINKNS